MNDPLLQQVGFRSYADESAHVPFCPDCCRERRNWVKVESIFDDGATVRMGI